MKIKSITDVITNSSTEVFIVNPGHTVRDVVEFLTDNNIPGWNQPIQIDGPESQIIQDLIDFGYLYDFESPESRAEYWIYRINRSDCPWEPGHGSGVLEKWKEFVLENPDRVREIFGKDQVTEEDIRRLSYWYNVPADLVQEFIDTLGDPLPEFLRLDPEYDYRSYLGCVGFSGTDDNSIPYDDFDRILDGLGGNRWHLG